MNILILHNQYQHRGGEDVVVEAEAALLRGAGHEVTVATVKNDEITGITAMMKTFARAPYDADRAAWARNLANEAKADVVHVHNFFPMLTPAVHHGAASAGAAVVQTLHNYRLLCASAMFLRDGKICEKCLDGSKAWGIVHRCYRNSLPGSLALARMQWRAERDLSWNKDVHQFIALTEFARSKFIAGGLEAERISVKPNFKASLGINSGLARSGALFVGRLSPEKGVRTLLEAWKSLPQVPLTIVGDGPERQELQALAPSNVRFTGAIPGDRVQEHMANAAFLIVPSVWYEGFPMTIVEAYSMGLPVIASRLGSLSEVVEEGSTGHLFNMGDAGDLVRAIHDISNESKLARMSSSASVAFSEKYSAEINLELLQNIYRKALLVKSSAAT